MRTRITTIALAGSIAGATIGIALAPGMSVGQTVQFAEAKGKSQPVLAADESALRYYAATRDLARVELEVRRLKRLNSRWQPPADLWSSELSQGDEDDLWELFAADRLDELQAAIAARGREQPSWRPSRDLTDKIERKRLRGEILQASKVANWYEVSRLSRLLDVRANAQDTELMWTAAEGHARLGLFDRAGMLLASALEGATGGPIRNAVILRAFALLPFVDAERLVSQAQQESNGESGPDAIVDDILRSRISAVLRDEGGVSITPAQIARLGALAKESQDSTLAELLGWYSLKIGAANEALNWFKLAIARGGGAMVAHGLAQSLLRRGQLLESEEVAHAWRHPIAKNSIFFTDILETRLTMEIPPEIPGERLARYAKETVETQSGEGAQGLAWYSYNSCQYDQALEWFERAVAWHPKETTVYGYALVLRRLKRSREFIEIVNRYDGLFPMVVGLVMDEQQTKPSPCDAAALQRPVRTAANTYQVRVAEPRRYVPRPDGNSTSPSGNPFVRSGFPAAVNPANPLRFSSRGLGDPVVAPPGAVWQVERLAMKWPLVARRVRGGVAMPYEQFGFSLLPAIDGTEHPESRSVAEIPPAIGTLLSIDSRNNNSPKATAQITTGSVSATAPGMMRSHNTSAP